MYWGGREGLEHREAADRYLGDPRFASRADEEAVDFANRDDEEAVDEEPMFASKKEQIGFDDAIRGFHLVGQGTDYEKGWLRGNAVRRLRGEGS